MSLLKVGSIALSTGEGGGAPAAMINTGFSASGAWSYNRPFTATQEQVPAYESSMYTKSYTTANGFNYYTIELTNDETSGSPFSIVFSGQKQAYQSLPTAGTLYGLTGSYDFQSAVVGEYVTTSENTGLTFTVSAHFTISHTIPYYLTFNNIGAWQITASTSDMSAISYVQTGTSVPYPQYATSTEGYMSAFITGSEKWISVGEYYAHMSSSGSRGAVFNDGPSTSTNLTPRSTSPSSFRAGQLQNFIQEGSATGIAVPGYTYTYGAITSGYSGYTGM